MSDTDNLVSLTLAELRGAIEARGWTIAQLASRLGIHPITLGRYLNGHRDMPVTIFLGACEAIEINPAIILNRAEERADDAKVVPLRRNDPQPVAADDEWNDAYLPNAARHIDERLKHAEFRPEDESQDAGSDEPC